MSDMREVTILPDRFRCPKCDRMIELWFNGGELDSDICCGRRYTLTYGDAPLYVEESDEAEE